MSDHDLPIIPGYAEPSEGTNDCGCCEGTALMTPEPLHNRPNLSRIAYRVGTHGDFKSSMLARLSSAALPALGGLKTRDDDDFSIALIDAWATVCDVLTFYQERAANEAYLATATERLSLIELGRLVSYRPRPGVAAGTDLVFTLEEPPGAPDAAIAETRIPIGTRAQSIPGPEETAQTFETVEEILARVAGNALRPRPSKPVAPGVGDVGTYLQGVATGLKPGDAVLIVGEHRTVTDSGSELWSLRKLTRVEVDAKADRTYIEWSPGLNALGPPAQKELQIFALRLRASLFGYNAPHPKVLAADTRGQYSNIPTDPGDTSKVLDWAFDIDTANRRIDLDAVHQTITAGSWVALTRPGGTPEAYKVTEAVDSGLANYAVSGRATRLTLDTDEGLTNFESNYRQVSVYGQSEKLAFAEKPIMEPVWGEEVELAGLVEGLEPGRRLIVRGKRARLRVTAAEITLVNTAEPTLTKTLARGVEVVLLAEPQPIAPGSETEVWTLRAPGGFEGTMTTTCSSFSVIPAGEADETIAEAAILEAVEAADDTHSRLRFEVALEFAFDRASTVVHANVAAATHGETASEILGSGDAGRPFQQFVLKQPPLTHVSAATDSGTESTLEIRVDDLLWHEVPFLYARGARERVYITRLMDDGATVVQFGDGREGARPPSGRDNILAEYRKGIGRAGSVKAGQISLLLDRPLGAREAINPLPASGGDDPEGAADVRRNTPVTTLTLGRVVSLRDYQDFAMSFAGIARATASWTWDGDSRRVLVTVAGPDGAPVSDASDTHENLLKALRDHGDPFVLVDLKSYRPATFKLKLKVKVDPDYLVEVVLSEVEAAVRAAYGFEARDFGQIVALSEIMAAIHRVAGVLAADVDRLYRTTPPSAAPILHARLLAQPPTVDSSGALLPAEILTIDAAPFDGLEVMA